MMAVQNVYLTVCLMAVTEDHWTDIYEILYEDAL